MCNPEYQSRSQMHRGSPGSVASGELLDSAQVNARAVTLIRFALRILEAPSVHVPNLRFAHSPFQTRCAAHPIATNESLRRQSYYHIYRLTPAHGRFNITIYDYISNFE